MFLSVAVFVSFSVTSAVGHTEPAADSSYVAAVYEHHLILNPEPHVPLSRAAALQHVQKNLDIYEEQAARAAQQGAQILVRRAGIPAQSPADTTTLRFSRG
ncbi:biotinidase-like protein [Lates japonicus]|uniref:Biotinidase-like protein n=1 Tax=Lates japonicus TaxID=270547 RepID=A0AAD3RHR7_LATJO|nr:biotinidase-like protein [Lates japonicus]